MQTLLTANSQLSSLFSLSPADLDKVVGTGIAGRKGICDVFLQAGTDQGLVFDQGTLKRTSCSVVNGAGVRVVIGDKTGYSYTDQVDLPSLLLAAQTARAIAEHTRHVPPQAVGSPLSAANIHDLYNIETSPVGVDLKEKIALLRAVDQVCRAHDPRIVNVSVSLGVEDFTVMIKSSLGGDLIVDRRPLIRLSVTCQAQDGKRIESGSGGGGARSEFSFFFAEEHWKKYALDAAKEAIAMLSAVAAPAGEMTVVLGPGWPGVLIHEAVGHGLEGDFNRKGTSAFAGRMGQMVASKYVTVVDEGVIPGRRGSLAVDDEGTPTERTVLIQDGRLVGYMQDNQNAALMGMKSTGNYRREDYKFPGMPRMTNTYLANGEHNPADIIRSVKHGLYATTFGGGQVDITNGNFTFSARGAFLIEDGKLTTPIKGATLIGNGPESLKYVSMVGNDLSLDEGIGTCGKNGQGVPVGVGMPTVRIEKVTVGGTGGKPVTGGANPLSRTMWGLLRSFGFGSGSAKR